MKFPRLMLLPLCVSTGFATGGIVLPTAAPVSDDVLLSAIAEVESGNNAAKRGHSGERTQLQIMPETWRQFSRVPHAAAASNPDETDRVARAYLAVIRERLRDRGLPETPFFIAASWNAGPGWKRLRRSTVSYAERVANLVEASLPQDVAPRAILTRGTEGPAVLPVVQEGRGVGTVRSIGAAPVIAFAGAN